MMATTKKRASSRGATKAPDTLRRDAVRLFNIVNDQNIPLEVRHALVGYVDDVVSDAPSADWTNNRAHFLRCFIEGARGRLTRPVGEIIKRLHKGETAEEIIRDFECRGEATSARLQAEELAKPEPPDRTSAEWRYWKLRRMERALRGEDGPEAHESARREFKQIAHRAVKVATSEYYHAAQMLPHFIIAVQEMEKQQKGGAPRWFRREPPRRQTRPAAHS